MDLLSVVLGILFLLILSVQPVPAAETCLPPHTPPGCEAHMPARMDCYWDCTASNRGCVGCNDAQKREFEETARKIRGLLRQEKARRAKER